MRFLPFFVPCISPSEENIALKEVVLCPETFVLLEQDPKKKFCHSFLIFSSGYPVGQPDQSSTVLTGCRENHVQSVSLYDSVFPGL